jgi:hypothetical protein
MIVAGGSRGSSRDVDSDRARAAVPPAASPSPTEDLVPTEDEALELFSSLDELRAELDGSEAGRVLVAGPSLRQLERSVPARGETIELGVLSLSHDQLRIWQVKEVPSWELDLEAEDLSVGRVDRRLGIEWTLTRGADGWRIAAWAVVEDRAVVGGR